VPDSEVQSRSAVPDRALFAVSDRGAQPRSAVLDSGIQGFAVSHSGAWCEVCCA